MSVFFCAYLSFVKERRPIVRNGEMMSQSAAAKIMQQTMIDPTARVPPKIAPTKFQSKIPTKPQLTAPRSTSTYAIIFAINIITSEVIVCKKQLYIQSCLGKLSILYSNLNNKFIIKLLSFWENDLKDVSCEAIAKIAKYFKVPSDYLLGLDD